MAWAVGPVGGMTRRREGRCPNSGVGIRQGSIRFNSTLAEFLDTSSLRLADIIPSIIRPTNFRISPATSRNLFEFDRVKLFC